MHSCTPLADSAVVSRIIFARLTERAARTASAMVRFARACLAFRFGLFDSISKERFDSFCERAGAVQLQRVSPASGARPSRRH